MKVFIIFFICIVAAFGEDKGLSDHERRIHTMLKEASKECGREMKIEERFGKEDGFTVHPNFDIEACLKACVDKKMGVMNEDGTYNLEHILSYAETPQMRERIEKLYTDRMKHCNLIVGGQPCKMAACVHGMPKCAYMKDECQ